MCALMMLILMMIWQCSHKNDKKRAMHTHPDPEERRKHQTNIFADHADCSSVCALLFSALVFDMNVFTLLLFCWVGLFWRRLRSHMPYIQRQHLERTLAQPSSRSIWLAYSHRVVVPPYLSFTKYDSRVQTSLTLTYHVRAAAHTTTINEFQRCFASESLAPHSQMHKLFTYIQIKFHVPALARWTITNGAIVTRMSHTNRASSAFNRSLVDRSFGLLSVVRSINDEWLILF